MKKLILLLILIFCLTSISAEAITINTQSNHMVAINNICISAYDVVQISYSNYSTLVYIKNGDIKTFPTSYDEFVLIQQALSVQTPGQAPTPVISPVPAYMEVPNYGYNDRVVIIRTSTYSPHNNYNHSCNTYNGSHYYSPGNSHSTIVNTQVNMPMLPVSQPMHTTAQYTPPHIVPTYYSSPHPVPSYY